MKKLTANFVENYLDSIIESPKSELQFNSTFELLVAVMLSAQCTDKRVNIITSKLFPVYNTPEQFAVLSIEELEKYISSCTYYHNKAKNIINASKDIVDRFGGIVPSTHEDLVSLSGVGNKTANVVQAVAFGQQAFAVDTHILRVSNRLGMVDTKNPDICERALKKFFDGKEYNKMHHLMLLFGRYYCMSRSPKCIDCKFSDYCLYKKGDSHVSR